MGQIVILLSMLGAGVLYAYLKFPPAYANKRQVQVFDMMVLGVCGFICLMWVLNIRSQLIGTSDEDWWQGLGFGGALGIEVVFLGVCFLLRNFYVFRPPSSGRGFFK